MAKKKEEGPSIADMLDGLVHTNQLLRPNKGILIPNFPLRWLISQEVLGGGSIIQLVGKEASCKSMLGNLMLAWAIRCGGYGWLIDTEFKTSLDTLRQLVGDNVYNSGRLSFQTAGSVNVNQGKGKSKLEEAEEFMIGWQTIVAGIVDTLLDSKKPQLRVLPCAIFIDSILGSADKELLEAIAENEGTAEGRSTAGMARANSIGNWLKSIKGKLAQTNTILIFSNHLKKDTQMGGRPGQAPGDRFAGGVELNHSCQLVIKHTRGAKSQALDLPGRQVLLSLMKNSFGEDSRNLSIDMFSDMERDDEGNITTDEYGYGKPRIRFDWDGALLDILGKHVVAGGKMASVASRELLPALSIGKGRVRCNSLDFDLTPKEFHEKLLDREDNSIYLRLMKHPRLRVAPVGTGGPVGIPEPDEEGITGVDIMRSSGDEVTRTIDESTDNGDSVVTYQSSMGADSGN